MFPSFAANLETPTARHRLAFEAPWARIWAFAREDTLKHTRLTRFRLHRLQAFCDANADLCKMWKKNALIKENNLKWSCIDTILFLILFLQDHNTVLSHK